MLQLFSKAICETSIICEECKCVCCTRFSIDVVVVVVVVVLVVVLGPLLSIE